MKKSILFTAVAMLFAVSSAFSAITIRYYNKDSKNHTMNVSIDGSKKTVTFESSRTSSVTIQGGATTCVIHTSCGDVTVKDGSSITVKDGCISFN